MLRNLYFGYATIAFPLLNEVLSLNAQEFQAKHDTSR